MRSWLALQERATSFVVCTRLINILILILSTLRKDSCSLMLGGMDAHVLEAMLDCLVLFNQETMVVGWLVFREGKDPIDKVL